jgi:hypothetical protein
LNTGIVISNITSSVDLLITNIIQRLPLYLPRAVIPVDLNLMALEFCPYLLPLLYLGYFRSLALFSILILYLFFQEYLLYLFLQLLLLYSHQVLFLFYPRLLLFHPRLLLLQWPYNYSLPYSLLLQAILLDLTTLPVVLILLYKLNGLQMQELLRPLPRPWLLIPVIGYLEPFKVS